MHSQFDDPLTLDDDRRKITATGPLTWNRNDAPNCRISVTLTQGSPPNQVTGTGHTGNYGHNKSVWSIDVQADDGASWDPNQPVVCNGTITMSGPPPADPWPEQTVSLVLEPAAAPA
jgi:hypothetical protein